GGGWSASVLAAEAGVTAATGSSHLHKLTAGGLLVVEAVGRRRNYRLAGPEVGALVEALERLAPALPVWSLEQSQRARAHREARVCYDHVAGRLGVEVMRVIVERGHLEPVDEAAEFDAGEVRYAITVEGGAFLEALGVTVPPSRRPVRHHADSTEGGPHLSGALGRALLARFVDLGWLLRQKKQRLQITPDGLTGFDQQFGLDLNQYPGPAAGVPAATPGHSGGSSAFACVRSAGEAGVARVGAVGSLSCGQQVAGDESLEREADASAGVPIVAGLAGFAPLDLGGTGELEGAAGGEVEEQEGGFGVDGEVAEAVEHVVAAIVGPPQLAAVDADEPWRAAAVGGVAAPFGVRGAEEEGVRAPDQLDILRREGAVVPHIAGPGLVKVLGNQDPLLDVLGAVAVGLLGLDD